MNVDEKHEIYQQGFSAGQEHMRSAPETVKDISLLKENQARMEQKIDNLITTVERMDNNLSEHIKSEDSLHRELQEGKADKEEVSNLRNLIYGVYGGFFSIAIAVIIYLLTK
jgi:predicted RNase H-like nuclease (RuvC/YqgF family)